VLSGSNTSRINMPSLTAKMTSASSRGDKLLDFASGERAIKSVTPFIVLSQTSRTSSATRGFRDASAKRSTTKAEVTRGSFSQQCAVNKISSDSIRLGASRASSSTF
jgi:hypothetical protein